MPNILLRRYVLEAVPQDQDNSRQSSMEFGEEAGYYRLLSSNTRVAPMLSGIDLVHALCSSQQAFIGYKARKLSAIVRQAASQRSRGKHVWVIRVVVQRPVEVGVKRGLIT